MDKQTGKIVIGALAHVNAGKTTLAETLLYKTHTIRKAGRVDHRDSFLDYDALERDKGITIFNKEARFSYKDKEYIYIDTPGHKDLSSERDRSLKILDAAIVIISAIDHNIADNRSLFETVCQRDIPIFIFVNKMDIAYRSEDEILDDLKKNISPECIRAEQIKELTDTGLVDDIQKSLRNKEIIPALLCLPWILSE